MRPPIPLPAEIKPNAVPSFCLGKRSTAMAVKVISQDKCANAIVAARAELKDAEETKRDQRAEREEAGCSGHDRTPGG